jgi:uncharacterized delta-60 repeat protein
MTIFFIRVMKKFCSLPLLIFATTTLAQPGSLDLTFDTDGIATADMGDDYSYGMALQSDGKIVMAGYSFVADYDISVARFNTDGSLDNTFSGDGKLTIDFGGFDQFAGQVAIAPDGKIVIAGTTFNGLNNDILVVRVNSDGTIDNTFDGDGIAITDINLSVDYGRDVTVQPDGKIVVAGSTDDLSTLDFAVLRYNTDGTLDNTFDTDGIAITDVNSNDDYARSITIQADGKLIVAGYAYLGFFTDFAAVRYNTDGTLDNTWSFDGIAYTGVGSGDDYGKCVAVQADGAVVISGYANDGLYNDFAAVRFTSAGLLDNTFDGDGVLVTDIGTLDDVSNGCAIQADGKIVLAGTTSDGTFNGFAVVRYNADGTLDTGFDGDGKVTTMQTADSFAEGMAIQSDGKIVVGGYYYAINADYLVARYTGSGCAVDTGVSLTGDVLTATATGLTYQWVDCDNAYADVPGETSQSFSPSASGNYAVIITDGSCVDTSACFNVCLVNAGVVQAEAMLTALASDATYQWVDCNNGYADIPGETGQIFIATDNGSFAVIVTEDGCSDTSACYNVLVGGNEENQTLHISVYPNPANSHVTVNIGQPTEEVTVKLISLTGQVLEQRNKLSGNLFQFDLSAYANGIYFVETTVNGITRTQKLVKK